MNDHPKRMRFDFAGAFYFNHFPKALIGLFYRDLWNGYIKRDERQRTQMY